MKDRPGPGFSEGFVFRKAISRLVQPGILMSAAYLVALLIFAFRSMYQALFRAWFFSSDEYVLAAEVIRFSNLDFRQHYFDMPGTPFIILNTVIWRLGYAGVHLMGLTPRIGIAEFTFQHMSGLFILMRSTTLALFLLSAVLLFVLASKLFGKGAGAVAAMLLVMSPIYMAASSFVRVESFAMVSILSAILWLDHGLRTDQEQSLRPPSLRDSTVIAGLLVGLAAGARLHAMAAGVPVLLLTLWLRRPFTGNQYPGWIRTAARYGLPLTWAAAVVTWFVVRWRCADQPAAVRFIGMVVLGWLVLSLACCGAYRVPRLRPMVIRAVSPDVVKTFLGLSSGVLLGIPTIVPQYRYFLNSVQMYTEYVDWDRVSWPLWKQIAWYLNHYREVVAPDKIVLCLFCVGAVWIMAARDRKALPYLVGAALFFVSKPLKMIAAPHHIILWLPFFFLVCAYPVGKAFEYLSGRSKYGGVWATLALGAFLYFCWLDLTPGPRRVLADAAVNDGRMHNIQLATDWIKANAEHDAQVAISYFCFNPDAFYVWLSALEVPVPSTVLDGRRYFIWWGHGSALKGHTGYACATRSDVASMKTTLDIAHPGEGTDPYSDPRFKQVAAFGSGGNEVDMFRFDYRQ